MCVVYALPASQYPATISLIVHATEDGASMPSSRQHCKIVGNDFAVTNQALVVTLFTKNRIDILEFCKKKIGAISRRFRGRNCRMVESYIRLLGLGFD